MARNAKDVSEQDALSYVAAYTCGNDVSSRKLQRDPAFAGKIPQWGFSKGFDTFAPLGPCLVSSALIPDPSRLHLKTIVDGETRQEEGVADLLFGCAYLISYLSTGTTLQKGSVIMTGTPGGTPTCTLKYGRIANKRVRCGCWHETTKISCSWQCDGGPDRRNWNAQKYG